MFKPNEECDLVMKGGITSGVVYPAAVVALKDKYRFRSVGGSSAGAIAAAATAAAEYGRDGDGFSQLNALGERLEERDFLGGLFQPTRQAQPVFELLLRLQAQKGRAVKWLGVISTLSRWLVAPALGWITGVFLYVAYMISRFGGGGGQGGRWAWALLIVLLVVAYLLALAALTAWRVVRLCTKHLRSSFYGMCTGMPSQRARKEALTPWLYDQTQACAGLGRETPLTFRHLSSRCIALEMMTTDLTLARPARLPFKEGDISYHFSLDEFSNLFPQEILDYLEENTAITECAGPDHPELRALPFDDLPVIVATRMSLSFPILLSAVPLWTKANGTPVRHWLSDGGIGSNFPVHFFDAWLPTRPTLGLNLVPSTRASDRAATNLARAKGDEPLPLRRATIKSTVSFLSQILDTMQNWRDTMQGELPGFRDRIRDIPLDEGEGGMNLTMPPETIKRLACKGRLAGERLGSEFDWEAHRFRRYRIFMRLLQRGLNRGRARGSLGVADAFCGEFEQKLKAGMPMVAKGDRCLSEWCKKAAVATRDLLRTTAKWGTGRHIDFDRGQPETPDPIMRITARV